MNAPELEASGPVRGMIGGHGPAICARAPQASRVLHRRASWLGLCLDLRAVNVANPFTKPAVREPNRIPVLFDAHGLQHSPPRGHREWAHAQDFRPHVNRRLGNDDLEFLHCRFVGVRRTRVLRFRASFFCSLNRAGRCRLSTRFTGRRLDNRDLRVGWRKWIARWLGATANNNSRGGTKGSDEKTLHGWPVYAEESSESKFVKTRLLQTRRAGFDRSNDDCGKQ